MNNIRPYFLVLVLIFCSSFVFGQVKKTDDVLLSVGGEVERPLKLTAADLAKLPQKKVIIKDNAGKDITFEGIEVSEILKLAGVKFGGDLSGPELLKFLIIEAKDGYRVIFALPELDSAFTNKIVLLAQKRDGKPLVEPEGPLRIILTDEKKQTRSVKQVISLTIRRAV